MRNSPQHEMLQIFHEKQVPIATRRVTLTFSRGRLVDSCLSGVRVIGAKDESVLVQPMTMQSFLDVDISDRSAASLWMTALPDQFQMGVGRLFLVRTLCFGTNLGNSHEDRDMCEFVEQT